VQLCATFEKESVRAGYATQGAEQRVAQLASNMLPDTYLHGLQTTEWPGRSQVSCPLDDGAALTSSTIEYRLRPLDL
jgi:hypothetical protein